MAGIDPCQTVNACRMPDESARDSIEVDEDMTSVTLIVPDCNETNNRFRAPSQRQRSSQW
jgi:hypothetical protein